jgi:sulfur carrier protein ThiS
MHIEVKLFSRFREHLPAEARGQATLELPAATTIGDLVDHLEINRRVKLVSVNDEPVDDWSRPLQDGDRVRIFPFVVGG